MATWRRHGPGSVTLGAAQMPYPPPWRQLRSSAVIFVEILRLILVVAGAMVGLAAGNAVTADGDARLVGAVIGVLVGYVVGGVGGRLADRGLRSATRRLREVPAAELLAGGFLGGIGVLIGVVVCIPLFVFVRQVYDYPICAAVAWLIGALGVRVGMANGRQLADAARITRRLQVADAQAAEGGVLVDTSAVMDRAFLVLGRAGLLGPEILVPEPVADELRTIAAGPDPVASRRARRGLEALQAVREEGVKVTVVTGDVPQAAMTEEKVLAVAARLGVRLVTCSADIARQEDRLGIRVVDLRSLAGDLSPDHVPGEHLRVDLVKPGRQAGQAVGYLPDGDMVVVNEAEHLVGRKGVEVAVLSTRPTSQGQLVFASLTEAVAPQ